MQNRKAVAGSLVDMQTGEKLPFQFNPEEIAESNVANWTKHSILGNHHPILQYASGDARTVRFTLKMYGRDVQDQKVVRQKVAWLRSCLYPDTAATSLASRPPHRVLLNLGMLYKGLPCVVMSVNPVYKTLFSPQIDPIYAEVEIELVEFRIRSVGYSEVRGGRA